MAYDKIIPVRRRLDHCLDYSLNEEKTDLSQALRYISDGEKTVLPNGPVLETAINCETETAYREMMETKRRWDKRGGVLGYHIIHSYAPGEVTPQEAHAAGVEFARRLLGDRYEVVVATHLDREHIHCHIVFNSVSFVDGKKYRNDFKAYFGDIRETSNEVSREHGLSVIEPEGAGKHYAEWEAQRQGKPTLRGLVRQDIDAALEGAISLGTLWTSLERQGYQIKRGGNVKHTAVKPPGGSRFLRLDNLGDEYTEAALIHRLTARGNEPPPVIPSVALPPRRYTVRGGLPARPRRKVRGFRALYLYYVYLLGRKPSAKRRPPPFAVRKEAAKLRQLTRRFYFLREYRVDTSAQLSMLGDALQAEIDALVERRRDLYEYRRLGEDRAWEIEQINGDLRPLRRKLKLCGEIMEDIPHIQQNIQLCQEAGKATTKRKERRHDLWR